jgi:hypothetical protein
MNNNSTCANTSFINRTPNSPTRPLSPSRSLRLLLDRRRVRSGRFECRFVYLTADDPDGFSTAQSKDGASSPAKREGLVIMTVDIGQERTRACALTRARARAHTHTHTNVRSHVRTHGCHVGAPEPGIHAQASYTSTHTQANAHSRAHTRLASFCRASHMVIAVSRTRISTRRRSARSHPSRRRRVGSRCWLRRR